jgi:hypothetical protein
MNLMMATRDRRVYAFARGRIMKFRTRLLTAFGVSAFLFGGVMLIAMKSADSQPMTGNGQNTADPASVACAHPIEHDGYYQTEYAARLRCEPRAGTAD